MWGAYTVMVDGRRVLSLLMLAAVLAAILLCGSSAGRYPGRGRIRKIMCKSGIFRCVANDIRRGRRMRRRYRCQSSMIRE